MPRFAFIAVAALLFNAFVWGLSWFPFRVLRAEGLHPLWANALIFAFGVTIIGASKPAVFRELLAHREMWFLAAVSGVTNAAFNWGVSIGEVVRVVLLFYLMPLWSVLIARVLLHERFSIAVGVRVMLALIGAGIVLKGESASLPVPEGLGDWLGILAGFTFAWTSVTLRRNAAVDGRTRAMAMLAGSMLVSGALAVLLSGTGTIPWPPGPHPLWVAVVVGVAVAFLASNLAYQYGAARLPSNVTSIVMISEVVFAAGSAIGLGTEMLTWRLVLGGALILTAALLAVLMRPAPTIATAH